MTAPRLVYTTPGSARYIESRIRFLSYSGVWLSPANARACKSRHRPPFLGVFFLYLFCPLTATAARRCLYNVDAVSRKLVPPRCVRLCVSVHARTHEPRPGCLQQRTRHRRVPKLRRRRRKRNVQSRPVPLCFLFRVSVRLREVEWMFVSSFLVEEGLPSSRSGACRVRLGGWYSCASFTSGPTSCLRGEGNATVSRWNESGLLFSLFTGVPSHSFNWD